MTDQNRPYEERVKRAALRLEEAIETGDPWRDILRGVFMENEALQDACKTLEMERDIFRGKCNKVGI